MLLEFNFFLFFRLKVVYLLPFSFSLAFLKFGRQTCRNLMSESFERSTAIFFKYSCGTFKRNIERTCYRNIKRIFAENVSRTFRRDIQRIFPANVRITFRYEIQGTFPENLSWKHSGKIL